MKAIISSAIFLVLLNSCQKEETEDSMNYSYPTGTYEYAYFKGTVSDGQGKPINDRLLVLQMSPCLCGSFITDGAYKMYACQRIGGKMPYHFPYLITLHLMDTTNSIFYKEFQFSSDLLKIDDTVEIHFQL